MRPPREERERERERETEKYIRGQMKEVAKLKPLRMPIFVGSPVRTPR